MKDIMNVMEREKRTVSLMIDIYCKNNHNTRSELCIECEKLKEYVFERLSKCRHGANKPVCRNCTTHCYNNLMRKQIIRVMRYSGPRMIYKHPLYTIRYFLKKLVK